MTNLIDSDPKSPWPSSPLDPVNLQPMAKWVAEINEIHTGAVVEFVPHDSGMTILVRWMHDGNLYRYEMLIPVERLADSRYAMEYIAEVVRQEGEIGNDTEGREQRI